MSTAGIREYAKRVADCHTWGNENGESEAPNTLAAMAIALADKHDQPQPEMEDAKFLMKALLVMRSDIGMLEFLIDEGAETENVVKQIAVIAANADTLMSDRKVVQTRYEGLRDLGFVQDLGD